MGLCTSFGLAFYWPTDIDPSGPFKGGLSDQIFSLITTYFEQKRQMSILAHEYDGSVLQKGV